MLPGFRFLFAAVLLTVSLVVFGLGAAALLRSAHQEFATIPSRRPQQVVFAQQPVEAPPTLAMLRVETSIAVPEVASPLTVPATTVAEEPPFITIPAEPEKTALPETVAALSTQAASTTETTVSVARPNPEIAATPDATKIEQPAPVMTVAAAPATIAEPVVTPAPVPVFPAPAPAAAEVEATPAAAQPTATLTDHDAKLSSTKIAMLGGPPIDTEPVPLPKAKPVAEPVKKVVKKRAVEKKRRVASRPVAQAAPQQTDPFGLPVAR